MPKGGKRENSGRKSQNFYHVRGSRYSSLKLAAIAHNVSGQTISNWCRDPQRADCWVESKNNEQQNFASPSKTPNEEFTFENSEEFLRAVVVGQVPADTAARIIAAKCLIQYEKIKERAKPTQMTLKELQQKNKMEVENSRLLDFEEKAAKIRMKYKGAEND